jgi:hypothetical protein
LTRLLPLSGSDSKYSSKFLLLLAGWSTAESVSRAWPRSKSVLSTEADSSAGAEAEVETKFEASACVS